MAEALFTLGIDAEVTARGCWAILPGERCAVYVIQAATGGYFTWCDDQLDRTVLAFHDPVEAIQTGLRRAAIRESTG